MLLQIVNEHLLVSGFSTIPFLLILAVIALFPIHIPRFWEKDSSKMLVVFILSLPVAIYLIAQGNDGILYHTMLFDYLPFVILLGALFIITGGIFIDGDIEARPRVNMLFLAIGAVLASIIGTTGAAMLLIRPLINTNKERQYKVHTMLFFIAIVANCGGLMTPLGDPPLFVLFLRGTPFFWFLHLAPAWLLTNAVLLIIYFFVDIYFHRKEPVENLWFDRDNITPISIKGKRNMFYLLGVVLSEALVNAQFLPFIGNNHYFTFLREAMILGFVALSLLTTKKTIHQFNSFSWLPIIEVVVLFAGIFVTMVPCLLFVQQHATQLGISSPKQFYYASGFLSSFLDNTPTALTFHSLAVGLHSGVQSSLVAGIPNTLLRAICLGSVLFGSMTYIGNGPNFMVRAIAENNGIAMPHFFRYIFTFSLLVLLPVYILVGLLFV